MIPLTYPSRSGIERIVAIEYERAGRRLLPFSVFTVDAINLPKDGRIAGVYDFDWCNRDKQLYYHCSGGGGRFYVNQHCKPKSLPAALWWDRSIVSPTNGGCSKRIRPLSDQLVVRFGYQILLAPQLVRGRWRTRSRNPFDLGEEDDTEYCSTCNDHVPTGSLCDHVYWCDVCSTYSTPDDPCSHSE